MCAVATDGVQLRMQGSDPMTVRRLLGGLQLALEPAQLLVSVHGVIQSAAVQRRRLLRDVSDGPSAGALHVPAGWLQLAAQQCEQAGLAAAIGAYDRNLLAGMHGQFRPFEQGQGTTVKA